MDLFAILLLGTALSLDSFAVSLSLGFTAERTTRKQKIRFITIIGIAHLVMIVGGWFFGENAGKLLGEWDHWIAFGLLSLVGVSMIREGCSRKTEETDTSSLLSLRNTLLLGIALSIDALITGFSLGLVPLTLLDAGQCANIVLTGAIIGLLALTISAIGIFVGKCASSRLGSKAEIFGGIILICIGIRILCEHLG